MKIFEELKKLGFKHYTENTVEELDKLPLDAEERTVEQALAFRWFREKHKLIHYISWVYKKTYDEIDWFFRIKGIKMANNNVVPHDETRFETYEEAELECLKKLIELVKPNPA